MDINTCYPARIVSFDPVTQTATVKLMLTNIVTTLDESYKEVPTPELKKIPVHFPRGGGHSITMPVVEGDDCLVMFAHRGFDHWLYEGEEKSTFLNGKPSPNHRRRHGLGDALCLVGFPSAIAGDTNAIPDFDNSAIEIRNEDRTQRISLDVETDDIEIVTDTNLTATVGGDVTADVTGNVTATIGGNTQADISGNVTATVGGTMTADVTGNTTITTPTLKVVGNLEVTGTAQVTGATTLSSTLNVSGATTAAAISAGAITGSSVGAGGKDLATHTHAYVGAGTGSSPQESDPPS